ncbi:MAG: exodeoxyribonuclease VII small subunit [Clostridia bacterium]|nr:exodeoxyribonuclease VII small subunit [Clostridia bacterium]
MAQKKMTFEGSMTRLEEVIRLLESGNAPLDESLKLYEEGIALVRACTERLDGAEQKIKMLQMQGDGQVALTDFSDSEGGR